MARILIDAFLRQQTALGDFLKRLSSSDSPPEPTPVYEPESNYETLLILSSVREEHEFWTDQARSVIKSAESFPANGSVAEQLRIHLTLHFRKQVPPMGQKGPWREMAIAALDAVRWQTVVREVLRYTHEEAP